MPAPRMTQRRLELFLMRANAWEAMNMHARVLASYTTDPEPVSQFKLSLAKLRYTEAQQRYAFAHHAWKVEP